MNDKRTNLNDLVGIPPRQLGESQEEYKLRVITEYSNVIKDAVSFDHAMGNCNMKKMQMTLDEFCIGWMDIYTDNLLDGMEFEDIPEEI